MRLLGQFTAGEQSVADVYNYIVPTGTIVPDASDIQTEVQNEYKQVFGQDLIVTPNTPQGILITAESLGRIAVADNNAALANQINPNLAGGIFLDAILALMGSQRTVLVYTRVSCTLTGVAGTIIPQGSQARDSVNGILFASIATVTLSPGSPGMAVVDFDCLVAGSVTVAINTLTQIVSNVLGWESVTNPAIQTLLGSETQSDEAAKLFRRNTLAAQGSSLALAITSALFAVKGVLSLTFRENIAAITQVIDGITMVAHSIYTCVDGGSNTDIANALVSKKSGGCNYNNGASADPQDVTVVIPFSGQVMHILFDRPDLLPILVRATVKANSSIQNPIAVVKKAILDYAAGLIPGDAGLMVGTSVSCFELSGAVNIEAPGIFVQNMETTLASIVNYSNAEIPIALWEKATLVDSSIVVVLV